MPDAASRARPPRLTALSPTRAVLLLMAGSGLLRLVLAWMTGLGADETYMVAAGRAFRLGYFDHPPASWWLSAGSAHLFGTEAPLAVRLPFILLFALSTWLMFRLTARLFTPRAGVWAAVAFNLAPVMGLTSAMWVLPDGPLLCALLGAALCLVHALDSEGRASWRWWAATGLCAGLALFSKYTAVLVLAGAGLYLLTSQRHRPWLARPQPWLAVLLAALVFAPVVAWNAGHGWASIAFQGGRAGGAVKLHPFAPLTILGGEALFLLPWIWLGLMVAMIGAFRRGPRSHRTWLPACLGVIPVVLFALVGLWSRGRVLYHWASPGYLMLFPLLGAWIIGLSGPVRRHVRRAAIATAALVLVLVPFAASEVRWYWLPPAGQLFTLDHDPTIEAVDWANVIPELRARGVLDQPNLVVGAVRWQDCGKVDYAFAGTPRLLCLTTDRREYGMDFDPAPFLGRDVLIIAPRTTLAQVQAQLAGQFASLTALPPAMIRHAGAPVLEAPVYLGHFWRGDAP